MMSQLQKKHDFSLAPFDDDDSIDMQILGVVMALVWLLMTRNGIKAVPESASRNATTEARKEVHAPALERVLPRLPKGFKPFPTSVSAFIAASSMETLYCVIG